MNKTSDRKTKANRRNAQKSTGPRTAAGKQAVRHNALKHGMLAKDVVIETPSGKESQREFNALLVSLGDDLQPVGFSEETLVEKIAVCMWRARRAIRFETGRAALGMDDYVAEQEQKEREAVREIIEHAECPDEGLEGLLLETEAGTEYLVKLMHYWIGEVRDGRFQQCYTNRHIFSLWNPEEWEYNYCVDIFARALETDGDDEEALKCETAEENVNLILKRLADKEQEYSKHLRKVRRRNEIRRSAHVATCFLPSDESLTRLQRYETANGRELYRALDQLQKLQSRRQGE